MSETTPLTFDDENVPEAPAADTADDSDEINVDI